MRWAIGPAVGGKINRTMYAHIVEEITEGDEQIVLQAIEKNQDDAPDALEGAIWILSHAARQTNNRYAVGHRASRRW